MKVNRGHTQMREKAITTMMMMMMITFKLLRTCFVFVVLCWLDEFFFFFLGYSFVPLSFGKYEFLFLSFSKLWIFLLYFKNFALFLLIKTVYSPRDPVIILLWWSNGFHLIVPTFFFLLFNLFYWFICCLSFNSILGCQVLLCDFMITIYLKIRVTHYTRRRLFCLAWWVVTCSDNLLVHNSFAGCCTHAHPVRFLESHSKVDCFETQLLIRRTSPCGNGVSKQNVNMRDHVFNILLSNKSGSRLSPPLKPIGVFTIKSFNNSDAHIYMSKA